MNKYFLHGKFKAKEGHGDKLASILDGQPEKGQELQVLGGFGL